MAVEETIRATVIRPNQAIKLRARKETTVREREGGRERGGGRGGEGEGEGEGGKVRGGRVIKG